MIEISMIELITVTFSKSIRKSKIIDVLDQYGPLLAYKNNSGF